MFECRGSRHTSILFWEIHFWQIVIWITEKLYHTNISEQRENMRRFVWTTDLERAETEQNSVPYGKYIFPQLPYSWFNRCTSSMRGRRACSQPLRLDRNHLYLFSGHRFKIAVTIFLSILFNLVNWYQGSSSFSRNMFGKFQVLGNCPTLLNCLHFSFTGMSLPMPLEWHHRLDKRQLKTAFHEDIYLMLTTLRS